MDDLAALRARFDEEDRAAKWLDHPDGCSIWSGGDCDCGTDNRAAREVEARRRTIAGHLNPQLLKAEGSAS